MTPALRRALAGHDDRWYLRQFWSDETDPLSAVQFVDVNTYLPDDLLVKVDRASMAVSLEVRVPFLDAELVTEAFQLPADLRMKDGVSKRVLRSAMATDLPRVTLERAKQGFAAPVHQWLHGRRHSWVRSLLDEGAAVQSGFLERNAIDLLSRRPDWLQQPKMWSLLMLELWLRREVGMPVEAPN